MKFEFDVCASPAAARCAVAIPYPCGLGKAKVICYLLFAICYLLFEICYLFKTFWGSFGVV
ncbi:MAG: hypothetical protein EAZ32_12115 [Cytophagia bacterium]|nr:MAG: hypothetical protein EAZ38_12755 [Cytophagales bacterium]TAG38567.1 MAG: hypothetical protein EAZ32_12115 [Cytophagia bacterium]TAG80165.1 MAG: hypothetical protein EAZ22_10065 [Cytophagales bacterium]